MRNKTICLLLSVTMLLTAFSSLGASAQQFDPGPFYVQLDGELLDFDQDPVKESDRVLVPMRAIFEALGAQVSWDEDTKTAHAVRGEDITSFQIDNTTMYLNGKAIEIDVPARQVGDRTLVPVRAISEALNVKVDWVEETQTVILQTGLNPVSASAKDVAQAMTDALGATANIQEIPAETYAEVYKIDSSKFDEVSIFSSLINVKSTEIIVIKARDESNLEEANAALKERHADLIRIWEHYLPDQYELVQNARFISDGLYAAFIVAEEADAAQQAFYNALK